MCLQGKGGMSTAACRGCLLASFALVLSIVIWGRYTCRTCNYISDTIPGLPYAAVSSVAVLACVLFYVGMVGAAPHRSVIFRVSVACIAIFLALTVMVTLPMSRRVHWCTSGLAFAGLLLLFTWDLSVRPRKPSRKILLGALLVLLYALFLTQSVCFLKKNSTAGPRAQAALILGNWLYVILAWYD